MACEVNNKETNSQCAKLLVRPTYIYIIYILSSNIIICTIQVLLYLNGTLGTNYTAILLTIHNIPTLRYLFARFVPHL